jgi:polyisoprenoid-binding protein YceI
MLSSRLRTHSFKTVIVALAILLSNEVRADPEVTLSVELNPMGSFDATSTAVKGIAKMGKNGSVSAENIILDLTTLETGIELRDKHMKETYFETKKYPKAILVKALGKKGKFVGALQVRGIKKKITGTYKIDDSEIIAEFTTKMSFFKIKKAKYMGVGAEDPVKVKVKLPVKK